MRLPLPPARSMGSAATAGRRGREQLIDERRDRARVEGLVEHEPPQHDRPDERVRQELGIGARRELTRGDGVTQQLDDHVSARRAEDHAELADGWKQVVRTAIPAAAILVPAAFFLSIVGPRAERPNRLILLAPLGASLSIGMLTLGVGPLRAS